MAENHASKPDSADQPSSGGSSSPVSKSRATATDDEVRIGYRMAGIGFETAAEVAAGALLGWLFDRWQGTEPWGLLIGSVVGIAVAMWSLIKGTLKLNRQLDQSKRQSSRPAPPPIANWHDENDDNDLWNDADDDTNGPHRDAD